MFTFGYEGLSIDEFIVRLKDVQVSLVVDVRELPLSRKKGFSKNSLREHLAASGIGYEHRPTLGCPKPVREQYRADGDWTAYTQKFLIHLAKVNNEVRNLLVTARNHRVSLMCFEADFETCHRTYVARAVRAAGGPAVQHLTARTVVSDLPAPLAA